jgi:hypothetical protein
LRRETSNVESLWTLFLCTSSNAGKQSAKRQLETQNSRSIRQLQALKLRSPHATLKPPNPPTLPRLGSETRDRDIIRLKSTVSGHACYLTQELYVRTCHGSGKLSCLSRFVLHTFASLSHLSHLKVFGTILLYSIRTSDLHSRPDQPCRWPPSTRQSPIRPSSQTNTMRSSWASRPSWTLNRTSALFT